MATVIIDQIEDTDTFEFFGHTITSYRLRELIQGELDSDPPTGTDDDDPYLQDIMDIRDWINRRFTEFFQINDAQGTAIADLNQRLGLLVDIVRDINADLRPRRIDELGGNR